MLAPAVALSIPSPSSGVWHLGPLPLRGYALAIILGIVAAIWIGEKRWVARGGQPGDIQDIAIWAVPFGLVGGRLYHVLTDQDLYFGAGEHPIEALYVWRGGLGVWGAIALGALGAVIAARRKGIKLLPVLDAMAPGVLVAQALGRWGNWFNQELFGKPTDLPWGLEVSDDVALRAGYEAGTTFHPTFLYESLWCLAGFALLLWADRRFRLGHGRVVALYIMIYTVGRGWIEMLRIDNVELDDVGGLRFNVWTSLALFVAALVWFVVSTRRQPGREERVYDEGRGPDAPGVDQETEVTTRGRADGDVRSTEADADRGGPSGTD
ncbi:prolipoprotein diacylglyceryl transferase [Nocardioides sp. YIM 152315]|uniref:prolipoprotein diacylglyceryl transferase n=1 Tax=Nocardioides sp. YIM 152315 TaxID=3031760 RepID=UPI0023DC6085|nr:prolipoprotein diacylglyceryl transferase [Nocardioides sp. YIM 152315]MDF1603112.1 prolipoprotein diacylglyceryl transferase [Nocardioides sp. YIM 152315]